MRQISKRAKILSDKPAYQEKIKTPSGFKWVYDSKALNKRVKDKKHKLELLGKMVDKIDAQVAKDLRAEDLRIRAIATVVSIVRDTSMRIGNEESASEAGTYGATTLKVKHVKFSGGKASFDFPGKKGVEQQQHTTNAATIKVLKELVRGKAQNDYVFEVDGHKIWDRAINRYLKDFDISAKDLRAFNANKLMKEHLKHDDFETALKDVAELIGHEPNTLKNNYLDPELVAKHEGKVAKAEALDVMKHMLEQLKEHGQQTTGLKPGVQTNPLILNAWKTIQPFLPAEAVITSGVRTREDQIRILERYWGTSGAATQYPNPSSYQEMSKLLKQFGYVVNAPGTSPHEKGVAMDVAHADLNAIVEAAQLINQYPELGVHFNQILSEDRQGDVHLGVEYSDYRPEEIAKLKEQSGVALASVFAAFQESDADETLKDEVKGLFGRERKLVILPNQFPKTCTCCGKAYSTAEEYLAQPFKGIVDAEPTSADPGVWCFGSEYDLLSRDCDCKSTLAVKIECPHELDKTASLVDRFELWHGVRSADELIVNGDQYVIKPEQGSVWWLGAWSEANRKLAQSYADYALVRIKVLFESEIDDGETVPVKPVMAGLEQVAGGKDLYAFSGPMRVLRQDITFMGPKLARVEPESFTVEETEPPTSTLKLERPDSTFPTLALPPKPGDHNTQWPEEHTADLTVNQARRIAITNAAAFLTSDLVDKFPQLKVVAAERLLKTEPQVYFIGGFYKDPGLKQLNDIGLLKLLAIRPEVYFNLGLQHHPEFQLYSKAAAFAVARLDPKYFLETLLKVSPEFEDLRQQAEQELTKRAPFEVNRGWWLAPDGKLFDVGHEGHVEFVVRHQDLFDINWRDLEDNCKDQNDVDATFPNLEHYADDEPNKYQREESDPKWDEVLVDKDGTKLTRRQIREHYVQHADQILKQVKGKPVLVYIATGLNTNILKRKHNDRPIVINTADEANSGKSDNLLYWADRRLLSLHYVLGTKTDFGWVDLDLHDFPMNKAKDYAARVVEALHRELDVKPETFESGGTGLHIQFELDQKVSTDDLRTQLKDLLDTLNQDYDDVSVGIIKGKGLRSDISTLKNTGSLRVPYALGETYGRVKRPISLTKQAALNPAKYPAPTDTMIEQWLSLTEDKFVAEEDYKRLIRLKTGEWLDTYDIRGLFGHFIWSGKDHTKWTNYYVERQIQREKQEWGREMDRTAKTASISGISKRASGGTYWVDPDNKVYALGGMEHAEFLHRFPELFGKNNSFLGAFEQGWLRIVDVYGPLVIETSKDASEQLLHRIQTVSAKFKPKAVSVQFGDRFIDSIPYSRFASAWSLRDLRPVREASLKQYQAKRDFDITPEPKGMEAKSNKHRYTIQHHTADVAGEHFDLRLENDQGVLSSWSVPKHHLPAKNERLLAIKTEDHPVDYVDFSGTIEEGYGKGKIKVVSTGKTYIPIEWNRNTIKFELPEGRFTLRHTEGKNWLLMRTKED